MGGEDQPGHPQQAAGVLLGVARGQSGEGEREADEGQEDGDGQPGALDAGLVPDDLLREVRVPDEHVLGEGDVGPEDREREEERAEVVEVAVRHAAEASGAAQMQGRRERARQAREEDPREEIDPEDVAVPLGLEAGDPIEGGDRHGQREEGHEDRREAPRAQVHGRVPAFVLGDRAADEDAVGERPQAGAEQGPRGEEGDVEPDGLARDERVMHRLGAGPRVEDGQGEQGGDEGGSGRKDEAGDALGRAAQGHAPARDEEMLDRDEEERAQPHARQEQHPDDPVHPEALRSHGEIGGRGADGSQGSECCEPHGRSSARASWARCRARR